MVYGNCFNSSNDSEVFKLKEKWIVVGKKDEVLVQREVVTNIEEDINEVINAEIEAVVKTKADELSKKYYRNITVKFGAKIN